MQADLRAKQRLPLIFSLSLHKSLAARSIARVWLKTCYLLTV